MSSWLTPLPAPSTRPPAVPSGQVILYKDDNWTSQKLVISTSNYREGVRQTVDRNLFDAATFVAWNLPEGVVCTLLDNVKNDTNHPYDWSDCGKTADLVGNGTTRAVDLRSVGMNDIVSSFVWRHVNYDLGAIEVFEDSNYQGDRSTIFLSEWSSYDIHDISKWFLQDRISSIRWNALNDRVSVTMYQNADGSGTRFDNITGYSSQKNIANLDDIRFNDAISSFSWTPMAPKKEIVQPFQLNNAGTTYNGGLVSQQNGTNSSSEKQTVTLTINDTKTQNITVTTTDQFTTGMKFTVSQKTTGDAGVVKEEVSTSLEVSFQYQRTDTTTRTDTESIAISISQTATIPANSTYNATLTAQLGTIADSEYHTTATRWYDVPVKGGVIDPSTNNWYIRVEPVTLRVSGSYAVNWNLYVKATPL